MATQIAANMKAKESIAFGRGRQSLEQSVWYSGWLMTFLATGEETQGQFALIEAAARKGNVPPPHIHSREEETFYVLEGELTVFAGEKRIKASPEQWSACPAASCTLSRSNRTKRGCSSC